MLRLTFLQNFFFFLGFLTEQDSLKLFGLDEFVINPGSSRCPQVNHSELHLWRRYILLGMTWFGCHWSFQVEAIEDLALKINLTIVGYIRVDPHKELLDERAMKENFSLYGV